MQTFKPLVVAVCLANCLAIGNAQAQTNAEKSRHLYFQSLELAANATAAYFNSADNSLEQDRLESQLVELEAQLLDLRKWSYSDDFVDRSETLLLAIRPTIDVKDLQASSIAEQVALLDYRLDVSQNYLPAIQQFYDFESAIGLDAVQPGFNCQQASVSIEFTICGSLRLRDADGRMGVVYQDLRNSLPAAASQELLQEQLRWIQLRDASCISNNVECLLGVYRERVGELASRVAKY